MILHVGGFAVGAISMRSRPLPSAIRRASMGENTPSMVPSSSITRTSGARISRLTRSPSLPPRLGPRSRSKLRPPMGGRLPPKVLIACLLVHVFSFSAFDALLRQRACERTLTDFFNYQIRELLSRKTVHGSAVPESHADRPFFFLSVANDEH